MEKSKIIVNNLYLLNEMLKQAEIDGIINKDVEEYYPDKVVDEKEYYSLKSIYSNGEKIGFIPKGFLAKKYCKRKLTPKGLFEYYDIESGELISEDNFYAIEDIGYKFSPIGIMSTEKEELVLVCKRKISFGLILSIVLTIIILFYIY